MALTHWRIRPPHAVRFVSFADGSIDIEFESGQEELMFRYLGSQIEASYNHSIKQARAAIETAAKMDARKAPTEPTFDPSCSGCQWAKEHPTTECSVHPKTPAKQAVIPPQLSFPLPSAPETILETVSSEPETDNHENEG